MQICQSCSGTIFEYDTAGGYGFCSKCGTIVEENTIVNEIVFGETSTGAAMVQGSFVGQGATGARMSGPFGNRNHSESREQTIANASRKIQSIAAVMHLSDTVCLAATRLYTLAVENKFTKGRKSMNVVAVCLYVACRQKETRNYMLIDFSDLLQVNVFELGHTYLQLVQTLNLRLPLVDPSHYISRFAALLEFGEETHRVASDAVRLVQRFDRDWLTRGRRPAGICGAALLLAARMNNFRRSVQEIVQIVKIADTTLKKRLEEFAETPTGALTVTDFRNVWLDEEMDPPAYTKGKEREEERDGNITKKKTKGRKKRKRGEDDGEPELEEWEKEALLKSDDATAQEMQATLVRVDPSIFQDGILAGTITREPDDKEPDNTLPLFFPDSDDANIDPSLLPPKLSEGVNLDSNPADVAIDEAISEEVSKYLSNEQGTQLSSALDEVDERRQAQRGIDEELLGLDEAELDAFIMTEEEVKIKERVWVELNRDYLESIAARNAQGDSEAKSRKRRKSTNKPRDASTPAGSTVAESVHNLLKKNAKYSKRINYNALKDLFVDDAIADDDKVDDTGLYAFDNDKDEGEDMVVEEEGGTITSGGNRAKHSTTPGARDAVSLPISAYGEHVDTNHEVDYGDDKGSDAGGWDDMYEQEAF